MKTGILAGILLCLGISVFSCGLVFSQSFPAKPIRLVTGGPPGGGGDVVARGIAQKMSEGLGQQVIVDNKPGAGGIIASQYVASSPPDGYTIYSASASAFSVSPFLLKKRPYDPVQDFAPITLTATAPLVVTIHPSVPAKSIKELITLAKAKPGQLLYASNGKGSFSHLASEMFVRAAGISMLNVPYKGGTPAVIDTVSGQVQMIITALPTLSSQITALRLRALAVTSGKRSSILAGIPTVAESGLAGFEAVQWWGMYAPRNTPPTIIDRLYVEIKRASESQGVKGALAQDGAEVAVTGPAVHAQYLQADIAKWQKVIRDANIVLE
jgi:tripartite-type tricarboxylate transporter receptor subunit TctC